MKIDPEYIGFSAMLENLLGQAPIGIAIVDLNLKYLYVNQTLAALNEVSVDQTIGKHPSDILGAFGQEFEIFLNRVVATKNPLLNIEIAGRVQAKSEKKTWMVHYYPIITENHLTAVGTMVSDISEKKRNEDDLRHSRQMLQNVLDDFPGVVFWKDRNSVYTGCNKAFAIGAGLNNTSEIIGKTDYDLPWANTEAAKYRSDDKQVIESRHSKLHIVETQLQASGRIAWFDTSKVPLLSDSGKVIGVLGTSHDITDRIKYENDLKQNANELSSIFRTVPSGIGVVVNRVIIKVNDRLSVMTGYSNKELVGTSIRFLYPTKEDYDYVGIEYKQIYEKGTGTVETRWKCKDGQIIDVLLSATPLDAKDLTKGITFSATDITGRKKIEKVLKQLNTELERKNAELKSIIYTASHDLRSPLVNIQGFGHELSKSVESLLDQCEPIAPDPPKMALLKENISMSLEFIISGIEKLDSTLNGLLRLSRIGRQELKIEQIDMNAFIASIIKSMEYKIRDSNAKLKLEQLPSCYADISLMNQVFMNLIDNAIKFRDPSRELNIRISGFKQDNRTIYCIEDNGIGIKPEFQNNIFEPFHRLDPDKTEGEGLGLTIIKRILDMFNATIWVDSEAKLGSKFYVSIPSKPSI